MSYQKPQVLAENKTNGLYMMPCHINSGYDKGCKP